MGINYQSEVDFIKKASTIAETVKRDRRLDYLRESGSISDAEHSRLSVKIMERREKISNLYQFSGWII